MLKTQESGFTKINEPDSMRDLSNGQKLINTKNVMIDNFRASNASTNISNKKDEQQSLAVQLTSKPNSPKI